VDAAEQSLRRMSSSGRRCPGVLVLLSALEEMDVLTLLKFVNDGIGD
jgi:hypothetical protein